MNACKVKQRRITNGHLKGLYKKASRSYFRTMICGWNFEKSNHLKTYKQSYFHTYTRIQTHQHTDDIIRLTDEPTMLTNCRICGLLKFNVELCIFLRCYAKVYDFKTRWSKNENQLANICRTVVVSSYSVVHYEV